jgi:hypothetical protein
MSIFGSIQALIFFAFGIGSLGFSMFCLVDALRHRPDAFTAAGKRTKNFWLAILGVAVALSIVSVSNPFTITWIIAVVGAGVYAADVRPALRRVIGGGSGNNGPYGPYGR